MINTIIDWVYVPMMDTGECLYDHNELKYLYNKYKEVFPDHQVIFWPENMMVIQDMGINDILALRHQLDEVLKMKGI